MPKAYVSSTFENKRAVERCLADVAACDLYVGVFAWRYGWKPPKSRCG